GRRRQHRPHHHPSPREPALRGRLYRSGRAFLERFWRRQSGPRALPGGRPVRRDAPRFGTEILRQRGAHRRRQRRQRHRPGGALQGGYTLREQRADGRAGGRPGRCRGTRARPGEPATDRWAGDGEDSRDRFPSGGRAARPGAHLALCARRGRAPGHTLAPGLLLDRRQPAALHGHSGRRHRRRRAGRRRPYVAGVVQSRRPRSGPQAHSAFSADAHAHRGGEQGRLSRWKAELALGFNAVIWGTTFVLVKSALHQVSPLLFLASRFSVATVALAVMFRGRWRAPDAPRVTVQMVAAGAMIGLFLFAGYLLQTLGLQSTTAPKSAFLTGLATVMVPLLGALVY